MSVVVHLWTQLAINAFAYWSAGRPLRVEWGVLPLELLARLLRYAVRLPLPVRDVRALQCAVLRFEDRSPPWRLGGPSTRRPAVSGAVAQVLAAAQRCFEQHDYVAVRTEMFHEFLDAYTWLCLAHAHPDVIADALEYALEVE